MDAWDSMGWWGNLLVCCSRDVFWCVMVFVMLVFDRTVALVLSLLEMFLRLLRLVLMVMVVLAVILRVCLMS